MTRTEPQPMATSKPSSIADAVFACGTGPQRARSWIAVAAALAVHAGLFAAARGPEAPLTKQPVPMLETEVDLAPAPPPPPVQAPEPPPTSAPHTVQPSAAVRIARASPVAAQAARVIAQEPDPSAPVDLSADTFVTGTASAYAGGATAASGTSVKPVTALAPSTSPAGPPRAGPILSRPVRLAGDEWQCPWPHEAEQQQIDEQTVTLRVVVAADGHARAVDVLADPGYGVGAAARACALLTPFAPALDPHGHPVEARSPPIRVRFTR